MWVRFVMPAMDWKTDDVVDLDPDTAQWLMNIGKAVNTAPPAPPAPVVEAAAVEPAERAVKPSAKKRTKG